MSDRDRAQAEYDRRNRELEQARRDMHAARNKANQLPRNDPRRASAEREVQKFEEKRSQAHGLLGKAYDRLRKSK